MTQKPSFRSTITQALADTVIDESRSEDGRPSRSSMDLSSLPDVGDLVGGLYRLVRLLGKGTFGKVYVAERIDVPEHQVAIKLLLREMYSGRDVERELVMLAAAGHPHMVQLKDHGTTADYVWFTMPVYEGETLADRLRRGTLSLHEAHEIFVPIARSLEALHRAGLRHQDLKPDNLFLAQFGRRVHPIILDLGVAAERTSPFVAGTILFAAPEQTLALTGAVEDLPLNEKMDTYGLAATLLLSLVGMDHFPGANAGTHEEMATAQQVRAQEPLEDDALPELEGRPREMLVSALRRWFTLDASSRPSMTEMADELDVLLEKEREEAQAEQRLHARQKAKLLRARLMAAALVVMALALLGAAYAKRETLRLAEELDAARAFGNQSFDRLETCQSAQQLTSKQLSTCKRLRNRDHASFQRSLANLSKTGDETRKDCVEEVGLLTSKLKTCDDEAEAAEKSWTEERAKLVSEHDKEMEGLAKERDEARDLADARSLDIDEMKQEVRSCRESLASCQQSAQDNPYATTDTAAVAGDSAGPAHALPPLPPASTSPPSQPPTTRPSTTRPPPSQPPAHQEPTSQPPTEPPATTPPPDDEPYSE